MALIIKTKDPKNLLDDLIKAIEEKKIDTWSYNEGYFTHSPEQWRYKAWFKPHILLGELKFGIYPPKDKSISSSVYAIYHGRFIEMMLTHFDQKFSDIYATALIVPPDYTSK